MTQLYFFQTHFLLWVPLPSSEVPDSAKFQGTGDQLFTLASAETFLYLRTCQWLPWVPLIIQVFQGPFRWIISFSLFGSFLRDTAGRGHILCGYCSLWEGGRVVSIWSPFIHYNHHTEVSLGCVKGMPFITSQLGGWALLWHLSVCSINKVFSVFTKKLFLNFNNLWLPHMSETLLKGTAVCTDSPPAALWKFLLRLFTQSLPAECTANGLSIALRTHKLIVVFAGVPVSSFSGSLWSSNWSS